MGDQFLPFTVTHPSILAQGYIHGTRKMKALYARLKRKKELLSCFKRKRGFSPCYLIGGNFVGAWPF